ncbi:MAG: type II toxin-antitoxin system RelE/ParE family toxin [Gammaproteobacteria bacterium]|nr:MAG: type II toxin-antitoxin system RelE/ParE family toxin [Gammaproteobacteria bacterium]
MKVTWSPTALERAGEIAQFIALDDPVAAEHWVEGLFQSVGRLRDHPESGRIVPEFGIFRIREVIYGAYRVIYALHEEVEILTVRRASQLLRDDEIRSR